MQHRRGEGTLERSPGTRHSPLRGARHLYNGSLHVTCHEREASIPSKTTTMTGSNRSSRHALCANALFEGLLSAAAAAVHVPPPHQHGAACHTAYLAKSHPRSPVATIQAHQSPQRLRSARCIQPHRSLWLHEHSKCVPTDSRWPSCCCPHIVWSSSEQAARLYGHDLAHLVCYVIWRD